MITAVIIEVSKTGRVNVWEQYKGGAMLREYKGTWQQVLSNYDMLPNVTVRVHQGVK